MPTNHEIAGYYVIDTKGVEVSQEVREDVKIAFRKADQVKAEDIKAPKTLLAWADYTDDKPAKLSR